MKELIFKIKKNPELYIGGVISDAEPCSRLTIRML